MASKIQICEVTWQGHEALLRKVRYQVFVCELRLNPRDEFDQADPGAWHMLAFNKDNKPVATGRLSRSGEIGRIAVLMNYRDMGIGSEITRCLLKLAQFHQVRDVSICPELGWQQRFKEFAKPIGPVFMDSGIPHQTLAWQNLKVATPDLPYLH